MQCTEHSQASRHSTRLPNTVACLRLYAEGLEQREYQERLSLKFGRDKTSKSRKPNSPTTRQAQPTEKASSQAPSSSQSQKETSLRPSTRLKASSRRSDPHVDKLQAQINVLKASLGLSDDELQWKVESANGNAFATAERELQACEERSEELMFEIQELSQPARKAQEEQIYGKLVSTLRLVAKHVDIVATVTSRARTVESERLEIKNKVFTIRIEAEKQRTKRNFQAVTEAVGLELKLVQRLESLKIEGLETQEHVKKEEKTLEKLLGTLRAVTDRFGVLIVKNETSTSCVFASQTLEQKRSLFHLLQTLSENMYDHDRFSTFCTHGLELVTTLVGARAQELQHREKELEHTLQSMEMWKKRRQEAKEYADEMRRREDTWLEEQREKNDASLALMRSFVPLEIADLTVENLILKAQEHGSLFTYDLALYLKTNRFLHWIVTHPDDIVRANFLTLDHASCFWNWQAYDIDEVRAVARVLPASFALDRDGRKQAWRTAFLDHVRQLVAQQEHDTVPLGWDPIQHRRRQVCLPELTPKQARNPVFCYPTDAEMDARMEKFVRQWTRLESKRQRLQQLEDELIPHAKAEYLAVTQDARNEEWQQRVGKATLTALREASKQQHAKFCTERGKVKSEVLEGERAWRALTPSYAQYQAEVEQIRALKPELRCQGRISGPFPVQVELQPRERATFKKLSVQEEAQARKQELEQAIARRSAGSGEENEVMRGERRDEKEEKTSLELDALRLMQREDKLDGVRSSQEPERGLSSGFKRLKSLQVAIGVLEFLQKDFCRPKRVTEDRKGEKRNDARVSESVSQSGSSGASLSSISKPLSKDIIEPKSEALRKLLESNQSVELKVQRPPLTSSPGGGTKGNFLAELQRRFS